MANKLLSTRRWYFAHSRLCQYDPRGRLSRFLHSAHGIPSSGQRVHPAHDRGSYLLTKSIHSTASPLGSAVSVYVRNHPHPIADRIRRSVGGGATAAHCLRRTSEIGWGKACAGKAWTIARCN